MTGLGLPFDDLAQRVLGDLAAGRCVAIIGLSNSGKSTLMRALAGDAAWTEYATARGRPGSLVYVDCNRAVAISPQAFYEVVLRALLERLRDHLTPELHSLLRDHHRSVTEAGTAFSASLAFNLALTQLCEQMGSDLCLLIDEFDELYAALDDRALLNLRALRDRFRDRLMYVTATVRSLPTMRGLPVEGEFAEMFSRSTYGMPLLAEAQSHELLDTLDLEGLAPKWAEAAVELGGGHPGLTIAVAQVLASRREGWTGRAEELVTQEPQPRAECLKIWSQLTPEEQESLVALVLDPQAGLQPQRRRELEALGLLREGRVFSSVFEEFVARRGRSPAVGAQGVYVDADSGDVWVDGIRIPVLTDLEFRLMKLLYDRRDKLTDKYSIVTEVWGEAYLGEVDDARVEKLVSRLRSKIEADPSTPRYLITQRGRGYKLLSKPRSAEQGVGGSSR